VAAISNQYAAMPSMHIGWATWCAIAVWPLLRRRWAKGLLLLYPAATLFCIVVTANHFWIDGVGGLLAFGLGALIGWGMHRWNTDRLDRRHRQAPTTQATSTTSSADATADRGEPDIATLAGRDDIEHMSPPEGSPPVS
ncbi:MAG: phosphatase PAP2 family protein, partial [Actinomycetota bacterium]